MLGLFLVSSTSIGKFGKGDHTMGVPDSIVVPSSQAAPSKWNWLLRGIFAIAVFTQLHYLLREPSSTQPLCTRGARDEKEFDWYSV